MAGHSHFANIMHKKGAADAKRSKVFSKLAREITVAAKMGMPDPAMIFSCAGRKAVLGTRTEEEYKKLVEHFPDLRLAGFYTYGEYSPLAEGGATRFHNETFVSLLLGTD